MPKPATLLAALALAAAASLAAVPAGAIESMEDPASAADADYMRAVRAVDAKDYRGAIGYLSRVLEYSPWNADALSSMGFCHRKLGDYKTAISFYTRALRVNPDHRGANEYVGEAYLEINDLAKAEVHLARLQKICGTGCEEYRDLKEQVEAYKARGGASQSSRRAD